MQCFMCFGSDSKLQMIQTDLDNDTVKRIKFVLPDFLIPDSMNLVFICATCLQVSFFHTIKRASLQNCSHLKHFNAMLKETDNVKCNKIRVILNSDEESAQHEQDATQITKEDKTYEFHYQQFVNDESSSNHLQDDSTSCSSENRKHKNYSHQLVNDESSSDYLQDDESSCSSDDSTHHHAYVGSFEFVDTNKFTEKDSNLTSKHNRHEDQPKTQRESEKKRFKCIECHKTFSKPSELKKHSRVHTGEKPYKCTTCQKTFTQLPNLNRHIFTHTGEKPHECDVCYKTFNDKSGLVSHKQIHNNVRPFQCAVCSKRFIRSANLKTHMFTHTGEKPHQCHLCEYKCATAGDLKKHIRCHTGEKPYSCKHCEKSFARSSHLKSHERIIHSNEVAD